MRIFVLGGDGFCGWPTSLKLAKEGHEVYIIDNQSRRQIDKELNSLFSDDCKLIWVIPCKLNYIWTNK